MNHKNQVHKSIGIGLILTFSIGSALWFLLPNENYSSVPLLGLYALPLIFSISVIIVKRYSRSRLIKAAYHKDDSLQIENAINQNNLETTVVSVLLVLSFGAITNIHFAKLIPIHLVLFLVGRAAFMVGYKVSPIDRLVGFVMSHYINLILLVMSLYVYIYA